MKTLEPRQPTGARMHLASPARIVSSPELLAEAPASLEAGDARHLEQQAEPLVGVKTEREVAPIWRKAVGVGTSVALLGVIAVGVIPQFARYSGTWAHMTGLDLWWWAAIAAAAMLSQVSGVWPYQAALPGLRFRHGFLQIETSTAISSTVPAGGAVAVGMTYKMFSSYGFADVEISTAVLTTGFWNFAVKLGMPIAAVALLATTGHPTDGVVGAGIAGLAAMVVAGVASWLVFRSETGAHWIGLVADRVVNRALHLVRKPAQDRVERSLVRFCGPPGICVGRSRDPVLAHARAEGRA